MILVSNFKYLRISPKKIKELSGSVQGFMPEDAISSLLFTGNKSGRILAKAIKSSMSNATNNLKLNAKDLRIKTIEILKGPIYKRWQPVSRGMAHQIKKRTAHIKVILEEKQTIKKEVSANTQKSPEKKTESIKVIKEEKKAK